MTTQVAAPTALLVADRTEQAGVAGLLRGLGFHAVHVDSADGINALSEPVSLCLIDLRENGEALRIARAVRAQQPNAVVIGIADPARPSAAADAIRAGVFDVLPRPPSARDLEALHCQRARTGRAGRRRSRRSARDAAPYGIVGTSPAMRTVMDLVQRAAAGRCGILICGERGTGREMIARAIHAHGANRNAPFVKVDCAGPTPEDIELQLFGVINKRSGSGAPERRSLERLGQSQPPARSRAAASCFSRTPLSCRRACRRGSCACCATAKCSSTTAANRVALDIRPIAVGRRDDRGGARRGADAHRICYERLVADPRRRARPPAAARRHSGAGHAFPEGTVQGQRHADQDA